MPLLVLVSVVMAGMQQCMIQNQNEMHKLSKVNTISKTNKYMFIDVSIQKWST